MENTFRVRNEKAQERNKLDFVYLFCIFLFLPKTAVLVLMDGSVLSFLSFKQPTEHALSVKEKVISTEKTHLVAREMSLRFPVDWHPLLLRVTTWALITTCSISQE